MKKLLIAALFSLSMLGASNLENLLNNNYNELFDLELQKSLKDKDYNSLSWISPVMLTFQRTWNTQVPHTTQPFNSYSISINQPIFKSGGIYYGIKFANANYGLARANVIKEKNALIAKAVELLFNIKKTKLSIQKMRLQIKNAKIEIKAKQELLDAGLSDSIDLDNALAKKDEAEIALLQLEASLAELKGAFAKISSKNPDTLRLPRLSLIGKDKFLNSNIELDIARANAKSKEYYAKMTRSKYLPTVSVGASYTKVSKAQPFMRDKFANYSLTVSVPLSINAGNEIESAKLDSMIAKIKVKNSQKSAVQDYKITAKKLSLIERRIALAKKEARVYARLLKSTKNLYRAGQRSINDVKLIKNSLKIKRLDAKIYAIDKQIELLKLYAKMR